MDDFILEKVCEGLAATTSDSAFTNDRFTLEEIQAAAAITPENPSV